MNVMPKGEVRWEILNQAPSLKWDWKMQLQKGPPGTVHAFVSVITGVRSYCAVP